MAMDSGILGEALYNAILSTPVGAGQTVGSLASQDQKGTMKTQWVAVAAAIISHITLYSELSVVMKSHTHIGVTPGTGVSGLPVSGPTAKETPTIK